MAGVRAQGLFGGPQQNTMAAALKAQGGAAIGQGIQVALSGLAAGISGRAARKEREKVRAAEQGRWETQLRLRSEMQGYQRSRQARLDKEAAANRAADNARQDRRLDHEERRISLAESEESRRNQDQVWSHQQAMAEAAAQEAQRSEQQAAYKAMMGDAAGAKKDKNRASRFWGFASVRSELAQRAKPKEACEGFT